MKKVNEANFIKRLKAKKEDALEYVIDTYLPIIKGIVSKVLLPIGQQESIEECINDVFLAIWNNAKKFDGNQDDFRKWICAIARFKAIDYYRKLQLDSPVSYDFIDFDAANSVEDEVLRIENRKELTKLLNKLSEIDRKIFMMKYVLGLSSNEIGEQLGLTRSAVDNRLHRGKKILNEKYKNFKLGGNLT